MGGNKAGGQQELGGWGRSIGNGGKQKLGGNRNWEAGEALWEMGGHKAGGPQELGSWGSSIGKAGGHRNF